MNQNCLLVDVLNGLQKKELLSKYGSNVLDRISIQGLIAEYKKLGGNGADLIDQIWHGDPRDKKAYYLMKCDDGFEVFLSERGGKHWRQTFADLDAAIFHLVDASLNGYGIAPVDSKIA